MSSSYGENFRITIFGQSHSKGIGVTIEGMPAGTQIDFDQLDKFLAKRAPGNNNMSTARKEADKPEILSGFVGNVSCGTPITAVIYNTDTRSKDYREYKENPRPGHADYTAEIKYKGFQDYAGGGHFSGRLTAPLCVAGGMAKQILEREGIEIISRVSSIGGIDDEGVLLEETLYKNFPTVSDEQGKKMQEKILNAKMDCDSVGGTIECIVKNLPVGLGDPIFGGMENRISQIVFGIPAVKGVEFGDGFDVANKLGSENNDEYVIENGVVKTTSNHCGGILGGITNGMPLNFKIAIKPTPSIAKNQQSVNLTKMENSNIQIIGRHDPCVVVRALPVVEAAAAIAIYDALLEQKKLG